MRNKYIHVENGVLQKLWERPKQLSKWKEKADVLEKNKNHLYIVGNNILQKIRQFFLKLLGLIKVLHKNFKYNIATFDFNLTFYKNW